MVDKEDNDHIFIGKANTEVQSFNSDCDDEQKKDRALSSSQIQDIQIQQTWTLQKTIAIFIFHFAMVWMEFLAV